MKYYSESLRKLFNTEKELLAAEAEVKKAEAAKLEAERVKKAQRSAKAKEVEQAFKDAATAQSKAYSLLKQFTDTYGSFHMSYSNVDPENTEHSLNNFLDILTSFIK